MARLLHRLGMLCARRPLVVIGAWIVLLVVAVGAVHQVGALTPSEEPVPGDAGSAGPDPGEGGFGDEPGATGPQEPVAPAPA